MMSDERLEKIGDAVEAGYTCDEWPRELLAEVHRLRRELDRYRDAGAVVESRDRYEGEG